VKRAGQKRVSDISPDLTSFGDIAFLLIIFFVLTASLDRPYGRQMEMPSAATPPQGTQTPRIPSINILADRILYTEGEGSERELDMTQLRAELWKKEFEKQEPKGRMVVLETAETVEYERYFQVVTMIAEVGGVVAMLSD
jgi:biopolymer transport protein ExbD